MQIHWKLLLVYYCPKASRLKINAITKLIAEWDQFFTLRLLLHDLINYIIVNVLLHPSE